ncbi:MAG: hypothetical protein IKY45_02455, partial [Clostridia bacterium]|nr:hypothetical protein [Clostridia bacterium]
IIISGQFYVRFNKSVLDPIMATALTIDDGNDYVIFVSLDIATIYKDILNSLKEEVALKNPSIDTSKIIINATHTHAGPLVQKDENLSGWGDFSKLPHDGIEITPPSEYFDFFINQVSDAVCESFESRKEGYISYGYGYAVAAHNRRAVYNKDMTEGSDDVGLRLREGTTKMYGNTALPEFSHLETGADHYANFMFTYDKDEKLTGAIVNIPCPSQNMELEYHLSADFWGDVRQIIKEKYGDIAILPQCAAAGDLAPRPRYYGKAEARRFKLKFSDIKVPEGLVSPSEIYRRREIALQICAAFDDVFEWSSKEKFTDIPVKHTVKIVELEKRMVTEEEYNYYSNLPKYKEIEFISTDDKVYDLKKNSLEIYNRNNRDGIPERYEAQKINPLFPMEMHVISVGNIAFATNQFELYMDFQHRIQARSPFEQTFIVQLCGQPGRRSGTYLATERAVKGRGYSANLFSNAVSPEGGQTLVEETLAELNKLYTEK